ncbi:unnamed protein product, partial [marine sediment metagenome]
KNPLDARPVWGPRGCDALRNWMNYRVNDLKISAEDDDPLFCVERSRKGFTNKRGIWVPDSVKGDFMNKSNMGIRFHYYAKKAGLRPLEDESKIPVLHSLRKNHKTALTLGGVSPDLINVMQGRTGKGSGWIYMKPTNEELIDAFKIGYGKLTGKPLDQKEEIEGYKKALGESEMRNQALLEEREKFRMQRILDEAEIKNWPEDRMKALRELLEREGVTFDEGMKHFRRLREEMDRESACQPPELKEI